MAGTLAGAALLAAALLCADEPPAPAAASGTTPAETPYVYRSARDPFVPLTGPSGSWAPATASDEEGNFKPETLELSGIIKTRTGRWAMLRSANSGGYLVKDGKIYDSKRKSVKGYVGIVKEKTLVVIGPDNKVTELALSKDREQKTP